MKKDTKVKKTHKPISIILPVVGGAALIGGATAGIVIGLGNTGKAVVAESKSVTITPGEAEAEFVFDFKDDVKDNLVKAKITNPTKATNEDPGQVIFSNDTLKVEITLVDGKAATRVKLVNAPTEKGTYTYTFNIRFTYENMDGEDVAHEVNGLKLVYEAVEDRVEIVDPELSQLTKVAELNGQKQAYVTYTGFKYRGNLKKKDLTINGDFGTNIDTQTTFDFNAETKEISINVRVDDGYAQNIHGSFTFLIDEEPMHVTNVNLTLTEENLITEPSDAADRHVFMDHPEQEGVEHAVTATLDGFTFNGLANLPTTSDLEDTRDGKLYAKWEPDEEGVKPEGVNIDLEVINIVNHKNTKKFQVKIKIWIDIPGVHWTTDILDGYIRFSYAEHEGDTPVPIATDWFFGQEYTIELIASDEIIEPSKPTVDPIIKLDTGTGVGWAELNSWGYSGLKEMGEGELSGVFYDINPSEPYDFLNVKIRNFRYDTRTFDISLGSNSDISEHVGEIITGSFQFYYTESTDVEPHPVPIAPSGAQATRYTFIIGLEDSIKWHGDIPLPPAQIDTKGHIKLDLEDFEYTGFETPAQRNNIYAEVTSDETVVQDISFNNIAWTPEEVESGYVPVTGSISGTLELTIDPKTTSDDLDFTVTFKYKDNDEDVTGCPIDLQLPVTSADVIYDTDDSKVEEIQMTTDGKCVFTKTFKYSGLPEATTLEKAKALITFTNSTLKAGTKTPTYEIAAFDVTNKLITLNISFTGLDVTQTYEATGAIVFDYASTKFGSEELLISRDYHLTILCQDTVSDDNILAADLKPTVQMDVEGKATLIYKGFTFTGFHNDPTLSKLTVAPYFGQGDIALPEGLVYTANTTSVVRTSNNTFDLYVPFTVDTASGHTLAEDYVINGQSGASESTYYFNFFSSTSGSTRLIGQTDRLFGGTVQKFAEITGEPTSHSVTGTLSADGSTLVKFTGFKASGFDSTAKQALLTVQITSGFPAALVEPSIWWTDNNTFDVYLYFHGIESQGVEYTGGSFSFWIGNTSTGSPKLLYTTANDYKVTLNTSIQVVEPLSKAILTNKRTSNKLEFKNFQISGFTGNKSELGVRLGENDLPTGTTVALTAEADNTYTVTVTTPTNPTSRDYKAKFIFTYKGKDVYTTTSSYTCAIWPVDITASLSSDLFAGQQEQATHQIAAKDGGSTSTIAPDQTLEWESSVTTVATVDTSTGLVTAVAAGNTVIKATSPIYGSTKELNLHVSDYPSDLRMESITGSKTVAVGAEVYYQINDYTSGTKSPIDPTLVETIEWGSTNETVATVQPYSENNAIGEITGVSAGTSNIWAIVIFKNGLSTTLSLDVTVTSAISSISIVGTTSPVYAGTEQTWTAKVGETTTDAKVDWYVESDCGGTPTITDSTYTLTPQYAGTITLIAISKENPSAYAIKTVNVIETTSSITLNQGSGWTYSSDAYHNSGCQHKWIGTLNYSGFSGTPAGTIQITDFGGSQMGQLVNVTLTQNGNPVAYTKENNIITMTSFDPNAPISFEIDWQTILADVKWTIKAS